MKRFSIVFLLALAAGAEERPDLTCDLWFKVVAKPDGRWAGFARVRIENAVEEGRAVVRFFEEGDVALPGGDRGWREEWTLDADLAPLHGLSRARSKDAQLDVAATFDGRALTRRAVAPSVERVQPWSREKACWPTALAPAALLRRYAPWKPGLQMSALTWASRADGDEARIGEDEWAFSVKSRGPRAVADLEEDCWTLEAAPRGTNASAPVTVVVDRRGLPVEMGGDGWTMKRARDERDAKDGRDFAWAHAGRRDPFRPALTPLAVRRVGEETPAAADLSAAEARALLDEAQKRLEAMQGAASLPEAEREKALAENSRAIRLAAGKLRDSAVAGVPARLAEILASAARLYDPALAAVSTAKAFFREIRESFEAGDEDALARIGPLMESLRELGADPDLAGRPEQATVRAIEEEAAGLDRRAAIRIEGLGRLRDHRPNGVMVVRSPRAFELELGLELPGAPLTAKPRVELPVAGAVALLGEKSYEEGDAIAEVEGCTVREIRRDAVIVEYRGESILMRVGE